MFARSVCVAAALVVAACAPAAAAEHPRHKVVSPGVTHGDLEDAVPLVSAKDHSTVYEMHAQVLRRRRARLQAAAVAGTGATGTEVPLPPLDRPFDNPALVMELGVKGLTKPQAHFELQELKEALVDVLLRSDAHVNEKQIRIVKAVPVTPSAVPFTAPGQDPEYDTATDITVQFDLSRPLAPIVSQLIRRKTEVGAVAGAIHDRDVVQYPRVWIVQ